MSVPVLLVEAGEYIGVSPYRIRWSHSSFESYTLTFTAGEIVASTVGEGEGFFTGVAENGSLIYDSEAVSGMSVARFSTTPAAQLEVY